MTKTLNITITTGYMVDVSEWSQETIDLYIQQVVDNDELMMPLDDRDITHYEGIVYEQED